MSSLPVKFDGLNPTRLESGGLFDGKLGKARLMATLAIWAFRARSRKQLARLNTAQLDDIGISAEQARKEIQKPFWVQ